MVLFNQLICLIFIKFQIKIVIYQSFICLKLRDSKILNQIFEEEDEFILKIKCNKNNKWILNEDADLYDNFENYFINIKNRNKSELINYLYIK